MYIYLLLLKFTLKTAIFIPNKGPIERGRRSFDVVCAVLGREASGAVQEDHDPQDGAAQTC